MIKMAIANKNHFSRTQPESTYSYLDFFLENAPCLSSSSHVFFARPQKITGSRFKRRARWLEEGPPWMAAIKKPTTRVGFLGRNNQTT
jgi:hypothetical protein